MQTKERCIRAYKKTIFVLLLFIVILIMFTQGCSYRNRPVETEDFSMGTLVTQRVFGKNARVAAEEVTNRLKDIEKKMTINTQDSELSLFNRKAGKGAISLSQDIIYVLGKSREISLLSNGAFDITLGPITGAWGIATTNQRIPKDEELKNLLEKVDYRDLVIYESNQIGELKKEGQSIDLGGIAKGYAGDEAVKIYKKHGIKSAYINLGGNVVVFGSKPDGAPWRIGIQNPRDANNKYIGIVEVSDKAVVTSGDYQRYFEEDGVRYHHIMDPVTGYPAKSGLISATIIANLSIDGDALATAVFVLGLEKGMELIESLTDTEGVFITENKEVYVTMGLTDSFIFTDESKEYKYAKKR